MVALNLSSLVDLAVGSANGNLNLNVLNCTLKIIAGALSIQHLKVEFAGADSTRIKTIMLGKHDNSHLPISQYKVHYNYEGGLTDDTSSSSGWSAGSSEELEIKDIFKKNPIEKVAVDVKKLFLKLDFLEKKFDEDRRKSMLTDTMQNSMISERRQRLNIHPPKVFAPMELPQLPLKPITTIDYDSLSAPAEKDQKYDVHAISSSTSDADDVYNRSDHSDTGDNDSGTGYEAVEDDPVGPSLLFSSTDLERKFLKNHQPVTLARHVESILNRLNRIEYNFITFMGNQQKDGNFDTRMMNAKEMNSTILTLVQSVEHLKTESEHFDFIINKIHNDLDTIEDSKIAHHDLAIALSVLPTLEDLNKKLSIFDFNFTLGDLEEKFRNIRKSNFQLETKINDEINRIGENIFTRAAKEELQNLNKAIDSKINVVKRDVKMLFEMDPEASGTVQFIKGGACISCANPAKIRTANQKPLTQFKSAPMPKSHFQAHLVYERDRVKKELSIPGTKDMNVLQKLFCSGESYRKQKTVQAMSDITVKQMQYI